MIMLSLVPRSVVVDVRMAPTMIVDVSVAPAMIMDVPSVESMAIGCTLDIIPEVIILKTSRSFMGTAQISSRSSMKVGGMYMRMTSRRIVIT